MCNKKITHLVSVVHYTYFASKFFWFFSRKKRTQNKNKKAYLTIGFMVHLQGFEPGTHWLRVSCSTNWAKGAFFATWLLYHHFLFLSILFLKKVLFFWKIFFSSKAKSKLENYFLAMLLCLHFGICAISQQNGRAVCFLW